MSWQRFAVQLHPSPVLGPGPGAGESSFSLERLLAPSDWVSMGAEICIFRVGLSALALDQRADLRSEASDRLPKTWKVLVALKAGALC